MQVRVLFPALLVNSFPGCHIPRARLPAMDSLPDSGILALMEFNWKGAVILGKLRTGKGHGGKPRFPYGRR